VVSAKEKIYYKGGGGCCSCSRSRSHYCSSLWSPLVLVPASPCPACTRFLGCSLARSCWSLPCSYPSPRVLVRAPPTFHPPPSFLIRVCSCSFMRARAHSCPLLVCAHLCVFVHVCAHLCVLIRVHARCCHTRPPGVAALMGHPMVSVSNTLLVYTL
jgi:hypothetical protein